MADYPFHEFASVFPLLTGDEFDALVESIRQSGLREPITLFEGKVLDGRNRKTACLTAGIEPKFRQFTGSPEEALAFVWDENFHRRQLSPSQRAACAVEHNAFIQRIRDDAAKRKSDAGKSAGRGRPKQLTQQIEQAISDRNDRSADAQLAKAHGTNRQYVADARKMAKEAPKEFEQVKRGEKTISQAKRDVKKREAIKRLDAVAAAHVEEPTGLYDCIVIDPPWPMEKIERDVRPNQLAMDYPTMSLADISQLKIPADDSCHLWVWTTHRFLLDAFDLLHYWKFDYCCTFVWHKPGGFQPFGLPQFNCEFALYGRRGAPIFVETKSLPVCFQAPRGKHSEKPEAFYDIVRRVTGGRRLDMFGRREIDGFDSWGKEAPSK